MSKGRRGTVTPASAIALVALFFALGGSAFAVGERIQAAQQRCANGAVRGIAVVTGDPTKGIANVPDQFSSAPVLFARRFNCTGRPVQVRRTGIGRYQIQFAGNAAPTAVAGGFSDAYASVEPAREGVFAVTVYPAGREDPVDRGFIIVLV